MEKNGTFFFKNGKECNVPNGKERSAQPWRNVFFDYLKLNIRNNPNNFAIVLGSKRKVFVNLKKIFIYSNKRKLFRGVLARLANFFGIELIKIYLVGSNVTVFENRKRVLYPSTLL